jgi:hypothetical protein
MTLTPKPNQSLGEWFDKVRAAGYTVPLPMCVGIEDAMKALDMSFAEVFRAFTRHRIVTLAGQHFIYNLRGHRALPAKKTERKKTAKQPRSSSAK